MRRPVLCGFVACLALAACTRAGWAGGAVLPPSQAALVEGESRDAGCETLWIFTDDFESETGWTAYDMSGTPGQENHWHIDTIRTPLTRPYLGDRTWWCGTYNECWVQPRGYGNDWHQILERAFPEVDANTNPGDQLQLEWDHRYAMERNFDWGYVDISTDGGSSWATIRQYTNGGYQVAGIPKNWTREVLDMDAYAGQSNLRLRFRFESDAAYSSQDQPDNALHSVKDGAWQLDNITWSKGSPPVAFWSNNCEGGSEMGWQHPDTPPQGQTGVTWWRGQFGVNCDTGQPFTCRTVSGWVYWAVDPATCTMVDDENAWLVSPPIDVGGAERLVGQWHAWIDLPHGGDDQADLYLASSDIRACVADLGSFTDAGPGTWYGGPSWGTWTDSWDAFAGNEWLGILWIEANTAPGAGHTAGMILDWLRVGIPSGDAGTVWELDTWESFNDWFVDELDEALVDTALVKIVDDQGIAEAYCMASIDGGATWQSYQMLPPVDGDWWRVPPLADKLLVGNIIWYYYWAMDQLGNMSTHPGDAPDNYLEMTVLPVHGSVSEPGILLVDKHGRKTPGERRDYMHTSEYYYREALDILGHEYDTYDVDAFAGADGPDSSAMKYYDTQIWFFSDLARETVLESEQVMLTQWLAESPAKERNLLLTGNNVGYDLNQAGGETLSFYETWLASYYVENSVGSVTVDSVPTLQDRPGGFGFMTYDDRRCLLAGGCPDLQYFDVVGAFAGIGGAEVVADYRLMDSSTKPAGAAYTHQTMGYQTVNLGFGMEFMMDSRLPGGYFKTGIHDRVDLMGNIMEYFGKTVHIPTGVVDDWRTNALSQSYPNPFNPATKIAYSVREAGPVTIEVYNVAGRVVRTLLDAELEAGATGAVVWDGANDAGERCASGVYFYSINAPGFSETKKMVMLK